jgi:hypothetical protein
MFTEADSPDVAASAAQRSSGQLPGIHFDSRRAPRRAIDIVTDYYHDSSRDFRCFWGVRGRAANVGERPARRT